MVDGFSGNCREKASLLLLLLQNEKNARDRKLRAFP
jgi:hypothetical protein